jgi:tetratricopeptide (TPR) repeat protein
MQKLLWGICLFFYLTSCKQNQEPLVSLSFCDSLMSHFTLSANAKSNAEEILFWKRRIDAHPGGFTNEQKYASSLFRRFKLFGDIRDVKTADSTVQRIYRDLKEKEPGPGFSLATYDLAQHRFRDAYRLVRHLQELGAEKYATSLLAFDVDFETGNYYDPKLILQSLAETRDYGYYFRLSKYLHYKGELEQSIQAMEKAVQLGAANEILLEAALSNLGDLYIHAGNLDLAAQVYSQSLSLNSCDFHSLSGLGWISLRGDKRDSLARVIFEFVRARTSSPEPIFRLYQVAQQENNRSDELRFARDFALQASDSLYGGMFSKYLIELYTGVLMDPAKAESLAERELVNRSTPQTNAWYAWSLYANHKPTEAYAWYKKYVSGKPLEGLELYYMGKMMQGLGKEYNSMEFFKAAKKNIFDLSPGMAEELENAGT